MAEKTGLPRLVSFAGGLPVQYCYPAKVGISLEWAILFVFLYYIPILPVAIVAVPLRRRFEDIL